MSELSTSKIDESVGGLRFDAAGLIPAVVQDDQDGTVLMVACTILGFLLMTGGPGTGDKTALNRS